MHVHHVDDAGDAPRCPAPRWMASAPWHGSAPLRATVHYWTSSVRVYAPAPTMAVIRHRRPCRVRVPQRVSHRLPVPQPWCRCRRWSWTCFRFGQVMPRPPCLGCSVPRCPSHPRVAHRRVSRAAHRQPWLSACRRRRPGLETLGCRHLSVWGTQQGWRPPTGPRAAPARAPRPGPAGRPGRSAPPWGRALHRGSPLPGSRAGHPPGAAALRRGTAPRRRRE